MTALTAKEELLRRVTHGALTEDDALLWMVLLHTHSLHLRPDLLLGDTAEEQAKKVVILPAETQRGSARVIAALWPDRTEPRAHYAYWYGLYNDRTPYEDLREVPQVRLSRLLELRRALAEDPYVVAVVEE
jgi:hypothetical protein